MIAALRQWWMHVIALTTGTLRVWWQCLPMLITGLTIGLLGYNALLLLAAWISGGHAWLSVGILSLGFATLLVGYLFCLRGLGSHLAVGTVLHRREMGDNLVDEPLSRLVALTLLPFMGIYAVFGEVQKTSSQLVTYEVITRGLFSEGVLTTLNPSTGREMLVILAVLAGTYLVRRTFDELLERTGRRVFGFLTALTEAFFMLVLIYGGTRTISRGRSWLGERRLAAWWQDLLGGVADLLRHIAVDLPDWIAGIWHAALGPGWEFFSAGLGRPVLWLAMAAMAFGSRAMSAAELWRETVGDRPTARRFPTPGQLPTGGLNQPVVQRAWTEVKELFFGDIDDKYLPTLQSLRLVMSAGASLIGAFCLLHVATEVPAWLAHQGLQALVGPARSETWVAWGMGQRLVEMLASEPLRLSLLAATFTRCLELLEAPELEVQA